MEQPELVIIPNSTGGTSDWGDTQHAVQHPCPDLGPVHRIASQDL